MDCIQCGNRLEDSGEYCPSCGWSVHAVIDASEGLPPGTSVSEGRFEIVKIVSSGRLSAVHLGVDRYDGSDVVIRFIQPGLLPNHGAGEIFLDHIRPLTAIEHPVMVKVLDVGRLGDLFYVVNEFVEGVPLRDLLDNRKAQSRSFNVKEIYPIMRQLASFLVESGLEVHGSLSPDNIWILPENLKVFDAGLAAGLPPMAAGHRLASDERARGFVAPEYFKGRVPDARTDVYSLGVMLGMMLTQAQYNGRAEMFSEVDPTLDEDLDAVLRRALLRDPRGRHEDAREFVENIAEVAGLPAPTFRRPGEVSVAERKLEELKGRAEAPPRREPSAPSFSIEGIPDMTVQVSMEDVIRAHSGGGFALGAKKAPLPERKTLPPPRRVSSVPPPRRKVSSVPPLPVDRGHQPQYASEVSDFDSRVHDAPISPRRPIARESVPPPGPKAPPPTAVRAGDSDPFSVSDSNIEVTQEIDLAAIDSMEEQFPTRDVTQEIDLSMIESSDNSSMGAAVAKLEAQAAEAERKSTEELIKRAQGLEGIDPRFVRAAHSLEVHKRSKGSINAAKLLKERADELDGIDPRFLRAAARLEEARISDIPPPTEEEENPDKSEKQPEESEDDWRERLVQQKEDSVISFIAPPVVDRSDEVRGFPRTQQRGQKKRPPSAPPTPPSRRR